MSILIKGLDMPKSCEECKFESAQYVNNYCRRAFCSLGADYEHCPLIEIPTPHGRLIDASELIKSYMKGTKTDIDDFYDTIDIIDNAPTILESEE